jgi:fused signal recognition particle receptor
MGETDKKPGFFQRLFGTGAEPGPTAPAPESEPLAEPAATEAPSAKKRPAKKKSQGKATKQRSKAALKEVEAAPPAAPVSEDEVEQVEDVEEGNVKPAKEGGPDLPPPLGPVLGERETAAKKEKEGPHSPAADGRREDAKRGWFSRLKDGLSRSSNAFSESIAAALVKRRLDEQALENIEDALIRADLGMDMAARIRDALAQGRFDKEITPDEIAEVVAAEIEKVLSPVAKPFEAPPGASPAVVLVVGVNGTGKTTTIGKLAHQLQRDGKTVLLAAADTFRAAAIDQLRVWGERIGADVVVSKVGADPAGVAYEALERARGHEIDIVLIDTAGRLQNKADLMAELAKIVRVLRKLDPASPHAVLLVLDATTGQNALNQVKVFQEIAGVTGLIVTKLDGTARAGILVSIAETYKLPVHAIGIGEGVEDLQAFDARDFARAIAGLRAQA